MAKQVTLKATKDRIKAVAEQEIEERLKDVAEYAVNISPVDTGAYVESFSMGRAGFGGGRSRSSNNKPKNPNPEAKRAEAYSALVGDIQGMNIKQMLEQEDVRFTLRNRAPHANTVEDGSSWQRTDGYYVFTKIRNRFG
jgi:hypothetical protein